MNVSFILKGIFLFPLLACTLSVQASNKQFLSSPFIINYTRDKFTLEDESDTIFEKNLIRAYNFVISKIPDKENRIRCPIHIRFVDLKGKHDGFTLREQKPCLDTILLDLQLERKLSAQLIVIHELTHLLRHQYNPNEELWLDEGLANLMKSLFLGLWPIEFENDLKNISEFSLTNSESFYTKSEFRGYTTSYFILHYLYNKLGGDSFLSLLLKSTKHGWDNIEEAANILSSRRQLTIDKKILNKESLMACFAIALLINTAEIVDYGMFFFDLNYKSLVSFPKNIFPNFNIISNFQSNTFDPLSRGRIKYITSENKDTLNSISPNSKDLFYFIGIDKSYQITKIDYSEISKFSQKFKKWILIRISP